MNTIIIDNIYSKITGDRLPNPVIEQLNSQLSYSLQNSYFIVKHMNAKMGANFHPKKEWDGKVKLFWYGDKGGTFFTGMASEVTKILKNNKISYIIEDHRIRPPQNCPNLTFKPLENAEDRPYQDWTVDIAYKATRGIVEAACGSGKTMIGTHLISKIKTVPFLFMVLSTDLLDQAQEMLSNCLNVPIGKIGAGVVDIKDINVITVQTAIRAIHLNDKKFKIKEYQFDENDDWNDDTIEKTNKGLEIQKLIAECKGIIFDEVHHCTAKVSKEVLRFAKQAYWKYGLSVGPQSFIEMRGGCFGDGFVGTIEKAFEIACLVKKYYIWKEFQVIDLDDVFSRGWSGKEFEWKQCKKIFRHAGKPCVQIVAQGTNLLITPEHSVYYSKNSEDKNFVTVGKYKKIYEPKIICSHASEIKKGTLLVGDDGSNFENKNRTNIDMIDFCCKYMPNSRVNVHCNIEEIRKIDRGILRKIIDLKTTKKTIPRTVYNWRTRGGIPINSFIKIKYPPPVNYLTMEGAASKISRKINLDDWAYILGFYLGDGWVSSDGRIGFAVNDVQTEEIINELKSLNGIEWNITKRKMPGKSSELRINNGFVANILLSIFGRIRCYDKFIPGDWIINWPIESRRKLLMGLIDSDGSFYKGKRNSERTTFSTTSFLMAKGVCSLLRSLGLWGSFSVRHPCKGGIVRGRQIIGRRNSYIISWSKKRVDLLKSGMNEHFQHNIVKFKEIPVKDVCSGETPEWIYDLEMYGHPSFVADGVLVHNSATPYREDGQEMMIQALFGKKLVNISASYLIKHDFLVKPFIFDIHMNKNNDLDQFNSYSNVYSESVVNNETLNKLVIDLANNFEKNNITTLILVQQYAHGDNLKAIRPDLVFIKGNQPKKQRKQALKDLKDGTIKVAIATTLADEGLDIRRLGAVIVAGGGKSITRVYQRVGRTLRKFPDKEKAFVILFRHRCKFLEKHGKRVYNLLKKEDEFVIKQATPENILQNIDEIVEKNE